MASSIIGCLALFFVRMAKQLVCVVTGASQGIGHAIAERMLSNNCNVYNLDIKEPATKKRAHGGSHLTFLKTDVSNAKEIAQRLQQIYDIEHKLDVMVNNAGIFEAGENGNRCWDDAVSSETIDSILETNLGGVIHGTRAATQLMKQKREDSKSTSSSSQATIPKIINIASTAALGPFPDHPVYASTKAAVLHFCQIADLDLRGTCGIRVFCVCPGIINTGKYPSIVLEST